MSLLRLWRTVVTSRRLRTAATEESPPDVSEHYEYLVKYDAEFPAEWYPETLVSKDLQDDFYKRAMASSQPVHSFDRSNQGKLSVQRPNGSLDGMKLKMVRFSGMSRRPEKAL